MYRITHSRSLVKHSKLFSVRKIVTDCSCTPCTLIKGDGIVGPEMLEMVEEIFEAKKIPVKFEKKQLSEVDSSSDSLKDVVESVCRNKVALMGFVHTDYNKPTEEGSIKFRFKKCLELFANVTHVYKLPGIKIRHKKLDLIIVRAHTEGEYTALEYQARCGVVEALKIATDKGAKRIAKFAYDYAIKNDRKSVTIVHKANIMKVSDGLFLARSKEVGAFYPTVKTEQMIVDNTSMQILSKPHIFDVMVMPSLYGSILNSIGAGLMGGPGLISGTSYSSRVAVFKPSLRNAGIEEKENVGNPTGFILCAVDMLYHINRKSFGDAIKDALFEVLQAGKVRTKDIGGKASTQRFVCEVIDKIKIC